MANKAEKCFRIFLILLFFGILSTFIFKVCRVHYKASLYLSFLFIFLGVTFFLLIVSIHKASRCVILLMIPQLLSKKGRKLVIGYLFLLTLSGPVKNLMRNAKVLGHAVVCGQDQVKLALHDLIHSFKEPLHVIKDAINKMLPLIENVMENVKEKVVNIKDHVIEIVDNIQTSFIWLENVFNFCNEKLGTPFEKCLKLVETSEIRCRKSLTTPSTFCDSTVLAKMFCYSFKTFDGFCKAFTLSDDSLKLILKNVEVFIANIEEMFYVSVQVHHQFDFNTNSSKATHVIVSEIFEDLHERTEIVFNVFGCIEAFMSFFFLWILIKTLIYKHNFMTNLRYKNVFITKEFHKIDRRRIEMQKASLLPLTTHERKSFIEISNFRLISHEYRKIFEKSIFLFATSIHVCGILFADYSLFWLLSVIQYYGNQSKDFETEDDLFWISVIGDGVIAEMCQDLVMIFKPLMKSFDLQLKVCLPIPYRPNFSEYAKIGLLVISSWIFLIVEPYAMRLKCVIMSDQYPEKTAERTVWLYYHILRKRTTFFGFIKKQMKQDRNSHAKYRKETCFEIFKAKFDQYWICRKLFGRDHKIICMLCGGSNESDIIYCPISSCTGIFCNECFDNIENSCPMCNIPFNIGNDSEVSEIDSLDDNETSL